MYFTLCVKKWWIYRVIKLYNPTKLLKCNITLLSTNSTSHHEQYFYSTKYYTETKRYHSIETNLAYSLPKLHVLYKNENYWDSCICSTMSTYIQIFLPTQELHISLQEIYCSWLSYIMMSKCKVEILTCRGIKIYNRPSLKKNKLSWGFVNNNIKIGPNSTLVVMKSAKLS